MGWTLGTLYVVDPGLEGMSSERRTGWVQAQSRAKLAAMLILDDKPGMLDQMVESTDRDQKSQHPEFGEDILGIARQLA